MEVKIFSLFIGCLLSATSMATVRRQHPVFACNMGALTQEERSLLTGEIIPKLRKTRHKARELDNGYEIQFADGRELLPDVSHWLSMEGRCCPFFNLSMSLQGNGGPLTVQITGEEGVKAFIREDLPGIAALARVKVSP